MNNRRIEKLLNHAMDVLENEDPGIIVDDSGKKAVPSKYNGYIASFGPSVILSDLLQTLAFYNRQDGEGKDRKKVSDLMRKTLEKAGYLDGPDGYENLFHTVRRRVNSKGADEARRLKALILEAAVACKLAMRTFPAKKED